MKLFVMLSSVIVLSLSCGKHNIVTQGAIRSVDNAAGVDNSGVVPDPAVTPEPVVAHKSRAYETVYFNYDQSDLRSDVDAIRVTDTATDMQRTGGGVLLEGHCDERGTVEYNLALGQRRAASVAKYLRSMGVDSEKIKTVSYGKERPVAEGHDESAWEKNRRVEFIKE